MSACEQAGIDEATANQLALAAMTGDWDTFTSLAGTALSNLDSDSTNYRIGVIDHILRSDRKIAHNTIKDNCAIRIEVRKSCTCKTGKCIPVTR